MSNIEQYLPSGELVPRDNRRIVRARSGQQVVRQVRGGAVDVETDIAIDKIQNATMATAAGMTAVVNVATAQQNLELMVPAAAGRLALIADAHAIGVADTLSDLRCRLRRV